MLKLIGTLEAGRPTVLFLSGANVSPCVFERVESDGVFQFAAVDYCQSDGPWNLPDLGRRVCELIRELELGPTALAGWSAGGGIAMAAAVYEPELIAGLFLSNTGPTGKGHGNPDFPQQILDRWGEAGFFEKLLRGWFSRPLPPLLHARLYDYIASVKRECAHELAVSVRSVDFREGLRAYRGPVTLAHGVLDKARTPAHVEMMTSSMPQARVFWLENAGHASVVENAPAWQAALSSFLADVRLSQRL
ncbi:MAG: alpha/beta hydrolase [Pyramidobacter sp.]|nr:alpha/beta hydrolase [Pyramidobacter sp.]